MVILKLLYFMLPAYLANMAPVLGKSMLKQLAVPIDAGKKWKGKPVFGKNKTWRGLVLAVIFSTAVFLLQAYLYQFETARKISLIDYSTATVWIGILLGLGTIAGDAVESFFKRRMNIKPGKPWRPFDQIDFTIGALALTSIAYFPGWLNSVIIVIISAAGHVFFSHLGYYLKLKKDKW